MRSSNLSLKASKIAANRLCSSFRSGASLGGSGALLGAIVGGPIGAVVGGAIGAVVGAVAEHNPSGKTSHAIDSTVNSVRKAAGSTESMAKTATARTVAVAKGAAEGAKREMKATK